MPTWMATIDTITAGKAFGLAFLLAGVNPKNLALTLAATLSIAQVGASGAAPWMGLAVFIIPASLTVAGPGCTTCSPGSQRKSYSRPGKRG